MEEYIYREEDFISSKSLKQLNDVMAQHDFMPDEIKGKVAFQRVFKYLVKIIDEAPDYIPAYEYLIPMFNRYVMDDELEALEQGLEDQYIAACERVAERDNIFTKYVPWGYLENRPLMRGLNFKAHKLWSAGNYKQAHDLFDSIYKCNENDNIGARYPRKATAMEMSIEEFEEKFVESGTYGDTYKQEIFQWFDKSDI